ncbi:MAG: sulfatase [Planctomycetota bacterium]
MRAIMMMYDTLCRRFLPPYGCDWTKMPNLQRLAERSAIFDNCYVGSMPCMPARRELHTGRYNFLHRSWGPIEPYDDSMPELLHKNGIHSHLTSDHYHYWEDGGCTYHTRYKTWEMWRGQEGDPWKGQVKDPQIPECFQKRDSNSWRQDWINREFMQTLDTMPQGKTVNAGVEFIDRNHDEDNWFLHIETFDPHEPFYVLKEYLDQFPHEYNGPHWDWPTYGNHQVPPEQFNHIRKVYAALLAMCDDLLGRVLDKMDKYDLWKDTMFILNTDHGWLFGEHDEWAKCKMPFYDEVAHAPLMIWDPRCGVKNERRSALVQTIDLAPTVLDYFNLPIPKDMQGKPLKDTIATDASVRDYALFGIHGGHVNITDGRYVYMRAPQDPTNEPLFQYTLMPTHMRRLFDIDCLARCKEFAQFDFTKGCPVMKVPSIKTGDKPYPNTHSYGTLLFDLQSDPNQMTPLKDDALEKRMISALIKKMKESDAPAEQYVRLGLA